MKTLWIRLRTGVFAVLCAQTMLTVGLAYAQPTNYQGLWWNGSESGWGIDVAHQGNTIFATWFTYDATGKATYLSMTANKTASNPDTYSGQLIETHGPSFSAQPFNPAQVTRTVAGTGTLTFTDDDNGSFAYSVSSASMGTVQQQKAITRSVFGQLPVCSYDSQPVFSAATNYQDVWWVPGGTESGWGMYLTHQDDIIFAAWFTYDVDGSPMWLSMTAFKVAAGVYSGELVRTRGPPFSAVPFNPALVTRTVVGSATFTFADGNAATFAYTVYGISQSKTITRVLFAPPAGTMCFGAFGNLTFDKISLATFPGGQETITVTAIDDFGNLVDWAVQSDNQAIAQVIKTGSKITVTGMALGRTQLTVLSSTGVRRTVPVKVYDPKVLDAGEILVTYVDTFTCRWNDAHSGANLNGSFYHPVTTAGWHALGSLGAGTYGCAGVDGQKSMMVVRENPEQADPVTPPLRPPLRFEKEWDDAGTGGDVMFGAFWTPICEAGYKAMGTVVTGGWTSAGRNPPALTDVTCIRADLTHEALASTTIWNDKGTGGDVAYQGSFQMEAPPNPVLDTTTKTAYSAYLTTGTFVTQGQKRSCVGEGCWGAPAAHTVLNVLAVDLPMLIETPLVATLPRLTSYDQPPAETEPLMVKATLVPFTAIGNGTAWQTRGLHWMVNNSPFVRTERVVRWGLEFWQNNLSSVEQNPSKTFTKGVSTADSTTLSHTAGISITAGGGVEFLGTGGKVSATVSYQFGYSSQHSVEEFLEESTTVTINVPAHKAAAAWQAHSEILVKLHNPATHLLELVTTVRMADSLYFVTDDYPD